jgi:hypothetical protein
MLWALEDLHAALGGKSWCMPLLLTHHINKPLCF